MTSEAKRIGQQQGFKAADGTRMKRANLVTRLCLTCGGNRTIRRQITEGGPLEEFVCAACKGTGRAMKSCANPTCRRLLPIEDFYMVNGEPTSRCKKCCKEVAAAYRNEKGWKRTKMRQRAQARLISRHTKEYDRLLMEETEKFERGTDVDENGRWHNPDGKKWRRPG
jgi:hypothetical protein